MIREHRDTEASPDGHAPGWPQVSAIGKNIPLEVILNSFCTVFAKTLAHF
jgi:hypothetical protein